MEVADTGPGLNSIERERVFDEFERLGTHHHVPGTGLGLAISQLVAGRLGGTLVVESTVGVGSTFALVLPGAWVAPPADGPDVRG